MSTTESSKVLFSLSKTDTEILVTTQRRAEIQDRRADAQKELSRLKTEIEETQAKHLQLKARQELEEERLRSEEKKIIERRKQLTALGGTKGAKLVEREIDIAARTLQTMEQRMIQATEDAEAHTKRVEELQKLVEERQLALETSTSEEEQKLSDILERLSVLEGQRDREISKLEDRLKTLYLRVRTRYPGGAIAVAEGGACTACYRNLPPQLYNQVLAGALLQCPGCSRILVPQSVKEGVPAAE